MICKFVAVVVLCWLSLCHQGSAKSASGKMVAGSVRAQLARMFPGKSVPENEENVFPVRPVVDEFPSGPIVDPVPPSYMEPNREDFDDYIKEDEAPKVNIIGRHMKMIEHMFRTLPYEQQVELFTRLGEFIHEETVEAAEGIIDEAVRSYKKIATKGKDAPHKVKVHSPTAMP